MVTNKGERSMNTEIGTKFERKLTREELWELADALNTLGDRYLHTYEDGTSEIKASPAYEETPEDEMRRLKSYLSTTDYTVIKCMETGVSPSSLYPEVMAKRAEARKRINELEAD